jgi:RHS repeat-associated protein
VSIDALGKSTTTLYDARNNVTGVIDPDGNRTTFVFDTLDRKVQQIDPFGNITTYQYDATNRLTSQKDALNRQETFSYDAENHVTGQTWLVGGSTANLFTFTYDKDGNQLTAANYSGAYTMTYNSLDQMVSVKTPQNLTLTFSYDGDGNRTQVQDSQGAVLTSVYNANNLLQTRELGGSGITALRFDLAYDADNRVTTLTRYSNLSGTTKIGDTLSAYDNSSRLTNLQNRNGSGTAIANLTYTYDPGDRVTAQQLNGTTTSYGYDVDSQLTSAGSANYGYDANGNRNMTGYATSTANQMTNDGTWTYTYDAAGNTTQKSMGASSTTWTYTYDNANHLLGATERSASGGGGTLLAMATYVYDALGNRQEADDWTSTGGVTTVTRFAYDGANVYADMDGSNNLLMRRVYGDGTDQVVARESSGGTVAWYGADRLGSVIGLVDATGAPLDTIVYDAYGNRTSESSPANGDRYGFTGRELDSVTGLQYNRARWFDPKTGRWTSQDPLGFDAGDDNLYRYVWNGPTNATDASGLKTTTWKGGENTDWNNDGNWEGGVRPSAIDDVIIEKGDHEPSIPDSEELGTLKISRGARVTISGPGKGVTVHGDVTNEGILEICGDRYLETRGNLINAASGKIILAGGGGLKGPSVIFSPFGGDVVNRGGGRIIVKGECAIEGDVQNSGQIIFPETTDLTVSKLVLPRRATFSNLPGGVIKMTAFGNKLSGLLDVGAASLTALSLDIDSQGAKPTIYPFLITRVLNWTGKAQTQTRNVNLGGMRFVVASMPIFLPEYLKAPTMKPRFGPLPFAVFAYLWLQSGVRTALVLKPGER